MDRSSADGVSQKSKMICLMDTGNFQLQKITN
jgi:hypothetical protein